MEIYSKKVVQQIENLSADALLEVEQQLLDAETEVRSEYGGKLAKLSEVKKVIQQQKDERGIISGLPKPVLRTRGLIKYPLNVIFNNNFLLNDVYEWNLISPANTVCSNPSFYFKFEDTAPVISPDEYNVTKCWGEDMVAAHDVWSASAVVAVFGGRLTHIITGSKSSKKLSLKQLYRVWAARERIEGTVNEAPDVTRARAAIC